MTDGAYCLPVTDTVKAAWAKVSGSKGSIWAVLGLFFMVQIIIGMLAGLGGKGFINFIFNFIGWLVQILASASLIYLGIRRAQDLPINYKMIKDVATVRMVLSVIGVYLLQVVILIPAGIVAGIGVALAHAQAEGSMVMSIIAFLFYLAAFILFVFLSVRMWLGFGAVIDKKLNPWEAIKLSFKATAGNVWNLIGLYFINILIIIVCGITAGIGLIWGIPWLLIIYGEAYKKLSTRQDMRPIG